MPQAITWSVPLEGPVTPTAYALRDDQSFDALLSQHSGDDPPAYAILGTTWVDTSEDPMPWCVYDGAVWIQWATIDATTNEVIFTLPAIAIADVTGLQAALDAKAPTSRTISAGGLLTGGGSLAADRTITLTNSTQAEAEAGLVNGVGMTPLRTAQAIAVQATLDILANALSTSRGALLFRGAAAWDDLPPGTAGHVLTSGGAGADVAWAAAANKNMTWQIFTASGTWTKPANCTKALVIATGGGGGGGASDNANGVAGSGAAGATAVALVDVSAISSRTVTIGAGGAGGPAGNDDGSNGGQTSWGTEAVAGGGGLGQGVNTAGNPSGGTGGVATAGNIQIAGGDGSNGIWVAATALHAVGQGGASIWGGGGRTRFDDTGRNGQAYGSGGGGGASNSTTSRAGGAGKAGLCVVIELYGTN